MKTLSKYRKAIAAVVVPILVAVAAKYGLALNDAIVAALTAAITGTVVVSVPNAGA